MGKSLKDLKPSPQNPRKITDKKLQMLSKSLNEFGDLSGIVFNKQTGNLIGGHQRLKVLPPDATITMDTPTHGYATIKGERFSYREVDWDETKEKAANIAANQHGGEFDFEKLTSWLGDLDKANFDMELTGFELPEIDELMGTKSRDDDDEIPENVTPITKAGDMFSLGGHRLLCGDSVDPIHVLRLLDGHPIDMVFTDPPYGMSAVTKSGVLSKNYKTDIMNDDSTNVAKDAYRLCSKLEIPKMVFWGANYYSSALPDATCWLVWDKNNGQSDQMDCELAWTNLRGVTRQFTQASEKKNRVHPTQKPVELITWCLGRFAEGGGGDILDLFGGSGSTMIACEKMNRKCFMMELDPHYCDVIIARWEKYTGQKSRKL